MNTPIRISKKLIGAMLNEDDFCKDNLNRLSGALVYITRVYYGLNPENVPEDIFRLAVQIICEKYPTLTFEQLNLTYLEQTIEKKQGVSLTKDELIAPIEDMTRKKHIVKTIEENEKQEYEKQQAEKEIIRNEYNTAKQLYFDSMGTGIYQGSVFQASMIMEAFASLLSDAEKIAIGKEAFEDYRYEMQVFGTEQSMFFGTDVFQVPTGFGMYSNGKPKPAHHFFISMRVVNSALQRNTIDNLGWKFIED